MESHRLNLISPIDGRYWKQTKCLSLLFSEFSLMKFRIEIEIKWIKKLSSCTEIKEVPLFNKKINFFLDNIVKNFTIKDAKRIKEIEYITNHDIKAIEYFIKEKFLYVEDLKKIIEFVHFACTSEDINNLSYALMLKKTRKNIILPIWKKIIKEIKNFSKKYRKIPLLSRTHGQPASPSTVGKEMINFVYRFMRQFNKLKKIEILGKVNGTVGNYNAHIVAYPLVNWIKLSKEFVNDLNISWNPFTTQIESHDYIVEILNCIVRFNSILINFNRDIWSYISLGYFINKKHDKEIGSSIMPHKNNPINFENSEGNLELSNALMNHLSCKLPISRLQRDLSDSTTLRNLGISFSYSIISYQFFIKGISKLIINKKKLKKELNNNWLILTEAIQTIMRKYGTKNSYERVKQFIKNKKINSKNIEYFIDSLIIPKEEKVKLKKLSPNNYVGLASKMVNLIKVKNIFNSNF